MVKEWADLVIFANYQTYAVAADDSGKKFKAQGGRRAMFLNHNPCWDAKNRFGLPDGMDFLFGNIASVIIPRDMLGTDGAVRQVYEHRKDVIAGKFEQPVQQSPTPEQIPQQPMQQSYTKIDKFTEPPQTAPVQPPKTHTNGIPKALADLMQADGITEGMIRKAVAAAGHFPEDTPIANYGDEYINGFIIGQWDSLVGFIRSQIDNGLPF